MDEVGGQLQQPAEASVMSTRRARVRLAGSAIGAATISVRNTGPNAKQPYPEADRLIAAANQLIEAARAGGWPVFAVRVAMPNDWFHSLMTGGSAIAGTKGAEFDARLARTPDTVEIVKIKSDAFANPTLDRELAAKRVGQLYIAGLDAKFCVKKTIAGALNRGYAVNVVRDAIATRHATPIADHVKEYEAGGAVMQSLAQASRELGGAAR